MSLKDQLHEKKSSQLRSGTPSNETPISEELSELRKQNELLRNRMIEIENDQSKRNEHLEKLTKNLEDATRAYRSEIQNVSDSVSDQLLSKQHRNLSMVQDLAKETQRQEKRIKAIYGYISMVFHTLALLLIAFLIVRAMIYGLWEGLYLEQLWLAAEGIWYAHVAIVAAIVGMIGFFLFFFCKGIVETIKNIQTLYGQP